MNERKIEHLARDLGNRAAARVDPAAVAQGVVHRLRTESVRVVWWRIPALQAAAVVVLLIGGGLVVGGRYIWNDVSGEAAIPAPLELAELGTGELAEVLDSLEFEAPITEFLPASLGDLDEAQLQQLLRTMEG